MKILADENMPYIDELFGEFGTITKVSGRNITAQMLANIDVLLVRSVTKVDASLLERNLAQNNKINFIGSATIGTDHIDNDFLTEHNIHFANAPGCNAKAVGEYSFIGMLELAKKYQCQLLTKTVGIIGAGNTGSALNHCLQAYGVKTMLCDPPLAEQGDKRQFYSLSEILAHCDVISLHVPIIKTGKTPTWHLFNDAILNQLKMNAWLINVCRGDVIDNQALLKIKQQRPDLKLVLDVWQGEPTPNASLVALTEYATPHIAGYSMEGKARGTYMLYQAFCKQLGIKPTVEFSQLLPLSDIAPINILNNPTQGQLLTLCRHVYNLNSDDKKFRQCVSTANGFDLMRKNHTYRRELSALTLVNQVGSEVDWLHKLGFSGVSL